MNQKQIQRTSLKPKQSAEQKTAQYYEETIDQDDEYEYQPNHSSSEQISDRNFDEESDDVSETAIKRNNEIELNSDRINPEVGIISKRKPVFAVLKVKYDDHQEYRVIFLSNIRLHEKTIDGINQIFSSFAYFEKITIEKLKYIASDERASNGIYFVLSKSVPLRYSFLLPDHTWVPLSILKGKKGKQSDEITFYRKFRSILYDKKRKISEIKKNSFSQCNSKDDFLKNFIEYLDLDSFEIEYLQECIQKSYRVRKTLEEYFDYFK